jgi:glycosyltransferase involved in cell wall biosynthesis
MTTPLVSIIIPIKNSHKYLPHILSKLISVTNCDFEVLCVDDKSDDDSSKIIHEYCKIDERIRYISGNGNGAGAARNIGMKFSSGKYIQFIDSDDDFSPDILVKPYEIIYKKELDILIFGGYEIDSNSGLINYDSPILRKNYLPKENVFSFQNVKNCFFITSGAPWNKVFNSSFIKQNHIAFDEQKYFNDMYFTYANLMLSNRVSVIEDRLYYYRIHDFKSLQGSKWNDISCVINALDRINLQINKCCNVENLKYSFLSFVLSLILALIDESPDESLNYVLYEYLKKVFSKADKTLLWNYIFEEDIKRVSLNVNLANEILL